MTIDTTTSDPEQLRTTLADYIRRRGTFRTPQVEAAFRAVPRHLFLPGVDVETAYAPQVVVTKRAEDGTAISSASSPNLVATMLEQLTPPTCCTGGTVNGPPSPSLRLAAKRPMTSSRPQPTSSDQTPG
ncbi:MAG: hypothetical protein ACRDTD_15330 [Pseudonocardiaceae bacterium]